MKLYKLVKTVDGSDLRLGCFGVIEGGQRTISINEDTSWNVSIPIDDYWELIFDTNNIQSDRDQDLLNVTMTLLRDNVNLELGHIDDNLEIATRAITLAKSVLAQLDN